MTVRRRDSVATTASGSTAVCGLPTRESGDYLFAFVGGGNQVTSYSAGWTSVQHTTGVEAQGELLWRIATADSSDNLTLNFDGGDPYRVVVAAYYSTRGYDLLHQVVTTSRQGTTSGTLPAVSFTAAATGNAGNIIDTYIFTRNGATVPTVAPGSLLHSYTSGHAFGFWEDTNPKDSTSIAIDLPVRTGHFRASVRFFEWEWTDWADDSVPFNSSTVAYVNPVTADESGGAGSRQGGADRKYDVAGSSSTNQHDATTGVWAATDDINDGMTMSPAFRVLVRNVAILGEILVSRAQYAVYWLTASRTAPPEATSGILPPDVYTGSAYVDPLVFGQEWEPTDTPTRNELTINVKDVGGEDADLDQHLGRPLHVKLVTGLAEGEVYDPDSMSANALASISDWHTIDVPLTWVEGDTLTGTWDDHGLPLEDPGGRFAVALVDDYTQTNTFPPTYSGPAPGPGDEAEGSSVYWAYEVYLSAYMAPRYRLKREIADVLSVIRQWPRDDSLGRTATPRRWPAQRGTRRIGGQP